MILLSRAYFGYAAGTIVQLGNQEEAALVSQGLGTTSAGPVTPGNVSTIKTFGRCGIAAAGTQVTVTNPQFFAESKFSAWLSNAAADSTALYITRVITAVGSVTFVLNAAATAAVAVDWGMVDTTGGLTVN